MATLLSETQWHGNPRPTISWANAVHVEMVPSPYYKDGRDVAVQHYSVTPNNVSVLIPTATVLAAGPAELVNFDVEGIWHSPADLLLAITSTGGEDFSTTYIAPATAVSYQQVVADLVTLINKDSDDMHATARDDIIDVEIAGDSTALTITTLLVGP